MFITKCTQTNASLQAFPNLTITQIKAFLLISNNLNKVLTRERIAETLSVSVRYVDAILKLLKSKGLLAWTRRMDRYNDHNRYTITLTGQIWMPYFKNTYKVRTGIFKRAMLSIALLISPALSEFSLLREDYIYNSLVKRELQTRVRVRKQKMTMLVNCKALETATEMLSLSKWGAIRLAAYPSKAIEHATAVFRANKSKKDDPIKWYFGICEKWCRENNTEPALVEAKKVADSQGIPKNPEWTQPRKPIEIPGTTSRKSRVVVKEQRQPMTPEEIIAGRIRFVQQHKGKANLDENTRILIVGFEKDIQEFYGQQT